VRDFLTWPNSSPPLPSPSTALVPREIADGGLPGLYLLIQPSGVKSWALRYRRANGKNAKLTLGGLDLSGREPDGEPKLGDPLSLVAARVLASDQLRQLKRGIDVAAIHVGRKRRERELAGNAAANTYTALARLFIDDHCRKHNRRWRESAIKLGFDYPDADGEPITRKGSLAVRWHDRELRSITEDELHDVLTECQRDGIPGRPPPRKGLSDSRARGFGSVLSKFFSWAKQNRHITVNPARDLYRPKPGRARDRVLNAKLEVRRADEIRWFWQAAGDLPEPYGIVLKLLLLTGCRRDADEEPPAHRRVLAAARGAAVDEHEADRRLPVLVLD
jgi:hypothetical protein